MVSIILAMHSLDSVWICIIFTLRNSREDTMHTESDPLVGVTTVMYQFSKFDV